MTAPPSFSKREQSNPFVRAGDGRTMGSLDLESFGVRRMEIQAASNPGAGPIRSSRTTAAAVPTKTPANSPDIAFQDAHARPEPTLEMLRGFSARNNVPTHFAVEPEMRPDIRVPCQKILLTHARTPTQSPL